MQASLDEVKSILKHEVKSEKDLVVGTLENGFRCVHNAIIRTLTLAESSLQQEVIENFICRYVILPNKLPPTRFEAHLEVHAGSVDEGPDEQVTNIWHSSCC